MSAARWVADSLLRAGRREPEAESWGVAMAAEAACCGTDRERLAWALGCWWALLVVRDAPRYGAGVLLGLTAMASYEWSADESLRTVAVLNIVALALGFLRPARFMLSGILVGLAVPGVLVFEVVSGLRPAYETHPQTLAHGLEWAVLVLPALAAAAAGRHLARRMAARVRPGTA